MDGKLTRARVAAGFTDSADSASTGTLSRIEVNTPIIRIAMKITLRIVI